MPSPEADTTPAPRCAVHPDTETYLGCASCGTPICPRCMVMTPVGAKCRSCSRAPVHPSFRLTPLSIILAIVAAVVGGLTLGVAGGLIVRLVPLASMLFPFVAGLAIAELINRVTRYKRDIVFRVIAGAGVVVSYVALALGDFLLRDPLAALIPGVTSMLLVNALMSLVISPINLLFLIFGIWVAVQRIG